MVSKIPIFGKKTEKEKTEEEKKAKEKELRKKETEKLKKEKEIETETRVLPVMEGLLNVNVIEKEKGTIKNEKFKLQEEERKIELINNTNSPLFSVEILIDDKGFTQISEKDLFVPILGPKGKDNNVKVISYSVDKKKYQPPLMFSYEIVFPEEVKKPVFLHGRDNTVTMLLKIENNYGEPLDLAYYLKATDEFKEIKLLEKDGIEFEQRSEEGTIGRIILRGLTEKKEAKLGLSIRPEKSEYIDLGSGFAKLALRGTLSRLKIRDVIMKTRLRHTIKKYERKEQPGVWDIEILIENPNDFTTYVSGEVTLTEGEIVVDETKLGTEHIELDNNMIKVKGLPIKANQSLTIKPIVVKSKIYPMFKSNLIGELKETINIKSVAQYDLEPLKFPVLRGEINKNIAISVDEVYRDIVGENEIPSIGDSCMNITTTFQNTGTAEVGYVRLIEGIPPGLSNPKNVKIFLNDEEISEDVYEYTIEPANADANVNRNLVIELRNLEKLEKILNKGDTIKLEYEVCSEVPVSGTFVLPTSVVFSTDLENIKLETTLPDEVAPKITIKPIVRSLEVLQDIVPLEEPDLYKVIVKLVNTSDTVIRKYKIYDLVPKSFEIIDVSPEANKEELDEAYKLEWIIEELQPKQEMELSYTVKGKGEYRVEELIGIEGV